MQEDNVNFLPHVMKGMSNLNYEAVAHLAVVK
jgi:hypothetical protein